MVAAGKLQARASPATRSIQLIQVTAVVSGGAVSGQVSRSTWACVGVSETQKSEPREKEAKEEEDKERLTEPMTAMANACV